MTHPKEQELSVLLPAKPKDDLGDVSRLLEAVMPSGRARVQRLYVHRPVQADLIPTAIRETAGEFLEKSRGFIQLGAVNPGGTVEKPTGVESR